MTSRHWCITVFDLENFTPPELNDRVSYAIWQLEESPRTGQLHVQGYIEFSSPQRRSAAQRAFGDRHAHCELRRGTAQQAADYCRKPESRVLPGEEIGTISQGQGHRSDLAEVQALLDQGVAPAQVARTHFATWTRYYRAFDRYWLDHQAPRDWQMEVRVYYGCPGSGKTHRAHDETGKRAYVLCHSNGGAWFDGYAGQPDVIVDDFYGWLPWSFLLALLDKYPMRVPTKGGHLPFNSRRIIFTSNVHPNTWYDHSNPHMQWRALERRITLIEEMNTVYQA